MISVFSFRVRRFSVCSLFAEDSVDADFVGSGVFVCAKNLLCPDVSVGLVADPSASVFRGVLMLLTSEFE